MRFLAHKLSAEAGVKWALACFRELESPEQKARKNESKEAAEDWTLAPSDTRVGLPGMPRINRR